MISTLRNQEEGAADKSYCTLLDCLCSWGQVGHILELICDWLPDEQPQSKVYLYHVSLNLLNEDNSVLEICMVSQKHMFYLSVYCSLFFQSNSASKRKVQIRDTRPVKPELALVYIEYLLTHPKNRECLLSAPRKKLNHLLKALETSKVTF